MKRTLSILALALFLGSSASVGAQSLQNVDIHGFGTWSFGKTGNDNVFLGGNRAGSYGVALFDLNLSVAVSDKLRLRIQPFWNTDGLGRTMTTGLSYAFAEWALAPAASLRVGEVKQPFGIYTEILDVGTLRPFIAVPQSIYGGTNLAGEAYRGMGISGTRDFSRGWGLAYDVYGGAMGIDESLVSLDYALSHEVAQETKEVENTRDVLGARMVVHTPLSGLSVGASGYHGSFFDGQFAAPRWVGAAHVEYVSEAASLRGEYAHGAWFEPVDAGRQEVAVDGGYAELGYHFTKAWQGALRAERVATYMPGVDISQTANFLEHSEVAAGLNYWLSSSFVLKASLHDVYGNRYALPELGLLRSALDNHAIQKHTRLLMIGAQVDF